MDGRKFSDILRILDAGGLLKNCLAIRLSWTLFTRLGPIMSRLLALIAPGIDGRRDRCTLKPNLSFWRSLCGSIDILL